MSLSSSSGCLNLSATPGIHVAVQPGIAGSRKLFDAAARPLRLIRKKPISVRSNDIPQIFSLLPPQAEEALRFIGSGMVIDTLGGAGNLGGANMTVLKVLDQNTSLPMVAELMKIKTDLADKKVRSSARDITRRVASILGQAKSASTRQVQEMKTVVFSPYHRPAAELALKWRGEADQALNTTIDAIGR